MSLLTSTPVSATHPDGSGRVAGSGLGIHFRGINGPEIAVFAKYFKKAVRWPVNAIEGYSKAPNQMKS